LVVSHDRAFLDRIADTLFVFDQDGGIVEFAGSFSDYQQVLSEKEKTVVREVEEKKSRPTQREKKSGLTFKERKELELLVAQIDVIEREIAALEASFSSRDVDPATLAQRTQAYAGKQELLEKNLLRWEELAAKE
jgi:ATP-binding cassette subfamily F protein uup